MKADENEILREIVVDYHWMARRYSDGRSTYATSLFNQHTRTLLDLGIELNRTSDNTIWARDGMGPRYDGLSEEERNSVYPRCTCESLIAAESELFDLRERLAALERKNAIYDKEADR